MKVALINQPWGYIEPPVHAGGSIPVVLYELGRRLARSCQVFYYTRNRFRYKILRDQQVEYRYIPIAPDKLLMKLLRRLPREREVGRPLFASAATYLGYALQIAWSLRQERCDVVHISNVTQLVPIIRTFNPRIKIVIHMHCEWLSQLDQEMIARRLRLCDLILGCSAFITDKIASRFPQFADRCRTLHNGVDVEQFIPSREEEGSDRFSSPLESPQLLYVGRVSPEKGVHVLLDAFAQVVKYYPRARLDIVGPEEINPPEFAAPNSEDPTERALLPFCGGGRPYHAAIQRQLAAPWSRQVTFLGNVPHTDLLARRYQAADVFIAPSIMEAFGIPVIEAMAAGVPVVASRYGPFPEVIQDGVTGLLAQRGDGNDFARAIVRLLDDAALRRSIATAARQQVVARYGWDCIAAELLGYYLAICGGTCSLRSPVDGQTPRQLAATA